MTLKAPLNPESMIPNSAEIYAGKTWDQMVQIGLYKDPSFSAGGETVEDVYANATLTKVTGGNKLNVSFNLHEITPEKLEILQYGLIQLENPATITGEVDTYRPGSREIWNGILLRYKNSDGDPIAPTVKAIIGGVEETLVKDTDYVIKQTFLGDTIVELKTGGELDADSPATGTITITYDATPSLDTKYVKHSESAIAKGFKVAIVNEYEYEGNIKKIVQYLDNCRAEKAVLSQISDSDNTTAAYPITIEGEILKQEFVGFSS